MFRFVFFGFTFGSNVLDVFHFSGPSRVKSGEGVGRGVGVGKVDFLRKPSAKNPWTSKQSSSSFLLMVVLPSLFIQTCNPRFLTSVISVSSSFLHPPPPSPYQCSWGVLGWTGRLKNIYWKPICGRFCVETGGTRVPDMRGLRLALSMSGDGGFARACAL